MKRTLALYVAWLVAAVMLVLAVTAKYPYGFYTLLRWICCAVFAYSAFTAQEENRTAWVWIFGVLAVLFNPIVLVHPGRDGWQIIDWITIGVIVVAGIVFWPSGVFAHGGDRKKKAQTRPASKLCREFRITETDFNGQR